MSILAIGGKGTITKNNFSGRVMRRAPSVPHGAPCVAVGRLNAVSWRVDCILSSSELKEVNEPTVHLKLQAQGAESGSTETTVVSVSADKFRVLLTGLFCYVLHELLSLFCYILFF